MSHKQSAPAAISNDVQTDIYRGEGIRCLVDTVADKLRREAEDRQMKTNAARDYIAEFPIQECGP